MIRFMLKNWSREEKILLCTVLEEAYYNLVIRDGRVGTIVSKAFANCLSWLEDDISKTE